MNQFELCGLPICGVVWYGMISTDRLERVGCVRCRRRIFEIYVVYLLTIVSKLCLAYSVAFRDSFDTLAFGGSFEINELYSGVMRELRYIAYMAELDFGTAAAITHTRLRRGNVYVQRR